MNKIDLNKLNTKTIANECSPVHVENVIADLVERLKMAEDLANSVMNLNPKAGERGEGFANNLIDKASKLLDTI